MRTPTSCTRWLGARWVVAFLAFLSMALPAGLSAQGNDPIENSAGTAYVVAFPDTTKNTFDARYPNNRYEDKVFLFIYSAVDNRISIRGNGYQRTGIAVNGGAFQVIDLMGADQKAPAPIATETCKPTKAGVFRIDAESPIIIYQYMVTKFGTEAWTAIPVEAWGNEYYAAAIPGEVGSDVSPGGEFDYNRKNKMFHAVITIIAAYDDTRITIVPNGQIWTIGCPTTNILLNAGEAYQVESYVDTLTANTGTPQPDFGGSNIFSTKPVGVISGNTRAQVIDEVIGLGKNAFKNMLIEWVPPLEQHGTEFVYLPTWDGRRPTGAPNEDPADKRKAEFVRVYGTHPGQTSGYFVQGGANVNYDDPIPQGGLHETRHTPNQPRVHRTDLPSQAFMHSSAVVKYAGTTNGWGGYIGAAYDGWGAYMVEMTPREQWVDFAPFYASSHPAGMEHYINVVIDTNHRNDVYLNGQTNFIFNRGIIEGTDLIWGSMSVQAGIDNYLEGRNGAKFYGFVYGTLTKGGHEEYRPGGVKPPDDDNPPTGVNPGSGDDGGLLHPSEYEEYLGIAYGYPLAPSRLVVSPPDSLEIKTKEDCGVMTIDISSLNENPVGLRNVRLDRAVNAKIQSQVPFPITGATKATIVVVPINKLQDASATIVIKDRSGKITTIAYVYYAERIELDPSDELNFGLMTPGNPQTKDVKVTNPLKKDLVIKRAYLIRGDQSFRILSPTTFPLTMPKDSSSFNITVEANPTTPDRAYVDTLLVVTQCDSFRIPLLAETADPCVNIDDLDFGVLSVGESKTLPLRICNDGGGEVRFNNPSGGAVLEWIVTNFTVAQADLDRIKASVLRRGECLTISVTFTSTTVGNFRDVARLWASTRKCRDTSVWNARVTDPGPQITGYDWSRQWVVTPGNACTKNQIRQYESEIQVYNTGDAPFVVEKIELIGADAPYFELAGAPDNHVAPGDRVLPVTQPMQPDDPAIKPQKVIFRPDAERSYEVLVRLTTTDGKVVENTLKGVGIESHVVVAEPTDFGRILWQPGVSVRLPIVVRSSGTRPLTITSLALSNGTDFRIISPTAADLPRTLGLGETMPVEIEYVPTQPGTQDDSLLVFGDNSNCDDESGYVFGRAYILSGTAVGFDFGQVLTCDVGDGVIKFTNTGNDPVLIANFIQRGDNAFGFTFPPTPVRVAANSTLDIPVTFAPTALTNYTASVIMLVTDTLGAQEVWAPNGDTIRAIVRGEGIQRVTTATIDRNKYHGLPGTPHLVEVVLDAPISDAKIDSLTFSLRYDPGMMRDEIDWTGAPASVQTVVNGTPLQTWRIGWTQPTMQETAGPYAGYNYMAFGIKAPAGQYFNAGAGSTIIKIPFITYLGDTTVTELPFFLTASGREACATINTNFGKAWVDSVCGLNFRLISAFESVYSLKPNNPNPFTSTTDIRFSLGLDGQTNLSIYNASGQKVATLVDAYLNPGEYTVSWDASGYPGGLYYYRLESGHWSRTETMMLQK